MKKYYSQMMIFYYVAHFKSFTKAAQHLHCSKAFVSQQMSELEKNTGLLLFHRNTRVIKLTLAGESIFEHAAMIAMEFQSFENTIEGLQNKVQGILRITSPAGYAEYILSPNLPHFLAQFPQISLEMNFTGELLNLVDKKIDIAIRLTHEPPLDRIAKKMGDYQMIICASPAYLAKHGEPATPKELEKHGCLIYSTEKNYNKWPFVIKKQPVQIDVSAKMTANSSKVLLEAALNGAGIARLPSYVVHAAIKAKQLKSVLNAYYPSAIPIYAVYAKSPMTSPKVHAFLDFLKRISE